MKIILKMALFLLTLLLLSILTLTLAEDVYDEGDGWIYHNGELKITANDGLINFRY